MVSVRFACTIMNPRTSENYDHFYQDQIQVAG